MTLSSIASDPGGAMHIGFGLSRSGRVTLGQCTLRGHGAIARLLARVVRSGLIRQ